MENTVSPLGAFAKAVAFAADKHRNQRRKDAEASPYINHPIALANVLANEGGVDDVTVLCAAMLHDTIEDTETTADELLALFGPKLASVVMEVTDDKSLEKSLRKQRQVEHAPHISTEATRQAAMDEVIDWLGFYNSTRLHQTLDYVSPMVFEQRWNAAQQQGRKTA